MTSALLVLGALLVLFLDVTISRHIAGRERKATVSALTDYLTAHITPVLAAIQSNVAAVQAKVAASGQLSDEEKAALDAAASQLQTVSGELAAIVAPPAPPPAPPPTA